VCREKNTKQSTKIRNRFFSVLFITFLAFFGDVGLKTSFQKHKKEIQPWPWPWPFFLLLAHPPTHHGGSRSDFYCAGRVFLGVFLPLLAVVD
jgi:hypothetical protein